jgi:hypothetical protein
MHTTRRFSYSVSSHPYSAASGFLVCRTEKTFAASLYEHVLCAGQNSISLCCLMEGVIMYEANVDPVGDQAKDEYGRWSGT